MYKFVAARSRARVLWAYALMALLLMIGSVPSLPALTAHAAEPEDYLLSLNRPVYASSSLGGNTPDLAVDGNVNSRWESEWQKDPQWIYVDLGASATISKISVNWENAYSSAYTLQVSEDELHWDNISPVIQGKAGEVSTDVSGKGRYVRLYSTERAQQAYGVSIFEFNVYGTGGVGGPPKPAAPNLALNKPVKASSLEIDEPSRSDEDKAKMEEKNYLAKNATDGNPDTRWSSIYKDNEWIYVDLGQESEIGSVAFKWEAAFGRAYDIQVSDDAEHWTTIYRQLNGNGGKETIPLYAKARYVKMAGIARGSTNGYSLFEFEVHAYRDGDPKPVYDIPDIPAASAVQVGAGSYEINDITQLEPKNPTYRTSDIDTPIPSNDWWQSILISNLGDGNSLITLPLKNWYTKQGLAVLNPGAGYAHGDSIDADGDPDLYLSSNNINPANIETKISGYGDYSASVILSDDDTAKMTTTFVKGSPFIYNTYENPDAVILQSPVMTRLFDDNNNPVLLNDGDVYTADHIGLEVTNKDRAPTSQTFVRHYGIFTPEGTTFMKLGNTIKIKLGSGENYLSLAALPSASELGEYYQHAYAFVTDTKVDYHFDENVSLVTTNFTTSTEVKRPGFSADTIMTLLPHQWKISNTPLTDLSYPSIRGTLKVRVGNTFTTSDRFNGLIPQFVEPNDPTYSRAQLVAYLDQLDADLANGFMVEDPYWQGKKLHPLALAVLISDQLGDTERRDQYLKDLKTILTDWYTYSPDEPLHSYYFHYSKYWGSLMSYASGFGINTGLTDHHFTYGYYIFASAVLATYDKEFLRDYGDMVETLIRDYANPNKDDSQFPWFRNFDPYEGHSWAGGYADNRSGNNQEAAGESLFSWVGEYMWGLVTDNDTYRDAGIWGFTTEEKAVEQYWFNYDGDNWVDGYTHATAGQVYGSATAFTTFFGGDPEYVYGIHWLPPAEWMTYYGRQPEKTAAVYQGMIKDLGGQPERTWFHIIWPFESIFDPDSVLSKWDTTNMQQNEAFNAYWFVHSMETLGHRSADIWADDPAVTVYNKDGVYTAQIWNPSESAKTIHFFNKDGALGSATVYANALVSVNPLKNTVLDGPDPTKGIKYLDRSTWMITASKTGEPVEHLTDNDLSTRWSSGKTQEAGDWLQIDLGAEQSFDTLFMNSGTNWNDYAHGYEVYVSKDGQDWGEPVASGSGSSPSLAISFPALQTAQFIKIVLTEPNDSWWSISEIKLAEFGASSAEIPSGDGDDSGAPDDRPAWTVTASSTQGTDVPANMLDGDRGTLWTNGSPQTNGQWLQVDLGSKQTFDSVTLDSGYAADDYPRGYQLFVSEDGDSWGTVVAAGSGQAGTMTITFPIQNARYIRMVQTGEADKWWSIAELNVGNDGIGKQQPVISDGWTVTASSTAGGEDPQAMLDGIRDTRWSTGNPQTNGDFVVLDLGQEQTFDKVVMDSGNNADDYARGYEVYVSNDGESWGNPVASGEGKSSLVTAAFPLQTARYVKLVQTRSDSHWWSISELQLFTADLNPSLPDSGKAEPLPLDRSAWIVTASTSADDAPAGELIDGNKATRWTTGAGQTPGQWIQIDLGSPKSFKKLTMDSAGSSNDYARGYQILISEDGEQWAPLAQQAGSSAYMEEVFPVQTARYVKIVQTEEEPAWWWSIAELNLYN
ncbi:coagulation factor 5/8 type domain protein [Paenibacillus yonginensis]|uniref:glucan endo-1,3-beta-D-glucosidase n=1 Tax=Paenibacillus yonginensis TaxID=1462996 RepID=A0A1B1N4K2_9BACL|nr:discoidin domain-containing protein [Paenibacillus yonginensis]ANS76332.1 coagulation factor 5/8 type domain protein [Paenibacillus yonginensis]